MEKITDDDWEKLREKIIRKSHLEDGHRIWEGNSHLTSFKNIKKKSVKRIVYFLETRDLDDSFLIRNVMECKEKKCILFEHLQKQSITTRNTEPIAEDYERGKKRLLERTFEQNSHLVYDTPSENGSYGAYTNFFGKRYLPHQVSWIVHHQCMIPKRKYIIHICGNKLCIRINHLKIGIRKDFPMGAEFKRINSKITEELAIEIKKSKGNGTQKDRADRFGVAYGAIQSIDYGKSWGSFGDR